MNPKKIDKLNEIIKTHNQYKRSQLWTDISVVLKCDMKEAANKAKTHCNMISFYAILYAAGKFDNHYRDFYEFCLENNFCDKEGFMQEKHDILSALGIESELLKYRDYNELLHCAGILDKDKFYQVKIKADTHGDHFMAAYFDGINVYISDTSYRGIAQVSVKYINRNNFQFIMEVV